jgi:hypothetical protein
MPLITIITKNTICRARQGKAGEVKARQGKTGKGKTGEGRARQGRVRQSVSIVEVPDKESRVANELKANKRTDE